MGAVSQHAVGQAMTEAMRVILSAGGFTLGDSATDCAVGMSYVVSPPETPLQDRLEDPAPSVGAGPSWRHVVTPCAGGRSASGPRP